MLSLVTQGCTKPSLRLRRKRNCGVAAGAVKPPGPLPRGFSKRGEVGPGPRIPAAIHVFPMNWVHRGAVELKMPPF